MKTDQEKKIEQRINDHLEATDRALSAKGVPFGERRSITADVEAHIKEMLAAIGNEPTEADVEAILRKLDPPESYGEGVPEEGEAPFGQSPPDADFCFGLSKKSMLRLCVLVAIVAIVAALAVKLMPLILMAVVVAGIAVFAVKLWHLLRHRRASNNFVRSRAETNADIRRRK
jgi:hypothetical protein